MERKDIEPTIQEIQEQITGKEYRFQETVIGLGSILVREFGEGGTAYAFLRTIWNSTAYNDLEEAHMLPEIPYEEEGTWYEAGKLASAVLQLIENDTKLFT